MLEGLIQSYLSSVNRAWYPRCEGLIPLRDSPRAQTALSSPESNQGETSNAKQMGDRKRIGFRAQRLREC